MDCFMSKRGFRDAEELGGDCFIAAFSAYGDLGVY